MDSELFSRLKAMIGQEQAYTTGETVDEGVIRRFALAIGDDNPLYCDPEYAGKTRFGGVIAPPTLLFEWDHHEVMWADDKGGYVGQIPLPPKFVRAGSTYRIYQPLRPGDVINTRSQVTNVYRKQGASGNMVFVEYESDYSNQRLEKLGKSNSTIIFWE